MHFSYDMSIWIYSHRHFTWHLNLAQTDCHHYITSTTVTIPFSTWHKTKIKKLQLTDVLWYTYIKSKATRYIFLLLSSSFCRICVNVSMWMGREKWESRGSKRLDTITVREWCHFAAGNRYTCSTHTHQ